MPAKSAAQKRLMDAAAHNPAFAKKVGIPVKVAKDFSEASKGKKFGTGGGVGVTRGGKGMINRQETRFGSVLGQEKNVPNVNLNKFIGKKEGGVMKKKMAKGGMAASGMGKVTAGGKRPHGEHTVQEKGHTKGKQVVMAGGKGMRKGGKC